MKFFILVNQQFISICQNLTITLFHHIPYICELEDKLIILSFTSSNSSFTECVRKISLLQNITANDNPSCTGTIVNDRCIYTGQTLPLSQNSIYSFTNTDFNECKHHGSDSYGGAIDCKAGDLTIKQCSFTQCYAEYRAGAVSFRSNGKCIQEDNIYSSCSSDYWSGAFDSWEENKNPSHEQKRCKYIDSSAKNYYGHTCMEYATTIMIDSNIYIHGSSSGDGQAGTVVNHHVQTKATYSNCLFVNGDAYYSGGLSFLGATTSHTAVFTVKFCFFRNNYNNHTSNTPYEIYFNQYTSANVCKDDIIHSFTATPNSRVFASTKNPQSQNWLPQG